MNNNQRKYLITGGAGFIGSALAKKLLASGAQVWLLDNLLTGQKENIPAGAVFIEGDVAKPETYHKLPNEKFDAVFHLAAQASGEISKERPELDLATNVYGTFLLLGWIQRQGIKRLIYSSSMAIYGDADKIPTDEQVVPEPLSFYGITKYAAEHYISHFSREGLNTTILRLFSVYGPGQNMKNMKQGMVSIYMTYLLRGEPILVKGSKDRFRDFIYIDDVVDALIGVIDNQKSFGRTYNLGTGQKTTVEQLVAKVIKQMGQSANYEVVYAGGTPADQFGLFADVSKIKKELGYSPKISLDEGLKRMSLWAQQKFKDVKL